MPDDNDNDRLNNRIKELVQRANAEPPPEDSRLRRANENLEMLAATAAGLGQQSAVVAKWFQAEFPDQPNTVGLMLATVGCSMSAGLIALLKGDTDTFEDHLDRLVKWREDTLPSVKKAMQKEPEVNNE